MGDDSPESVDCYFSTYGAVVCSQPVSGHHRAVIAGQAAGAKPQMTMAYRQVAVPFALAMALLVLVVATVVEIRRYRQAKALAAIERAS